MAEDLNSIASRYSHDQYTIRRKVFKLLGGAFHVYDPQGNVVLYSKQKAFKLKEDIRLFTGDDMQTQVLSIQATKVLDFSAAYEVFDTVENEKIGSLQRKGMKSILRDEWLIFDAQGQQIGTISEDSTGMALLRRFVEIASVLFPQKFHGTVNGQRVFDMKQNFNPFVHKILIDFSMDQNDQLDRRMGLAAGILLCAIEGRQG